MSHKNSIILTEDQIKEAILHGKTMGGAAKFLKIDARTFRKEAEKFNLYERSGQKNVKFDLKDILSGVHPQYPTSKITPRLVKEGLKEYKCECCGIGNTYNGKPISLELNHIDGDNSNHRLENLELLCPNCHSQTDTYRSKKLKFKRLNGELAESGLLQLI